MVEHTAMNALSYAAGSNQTSITWTPRIIILAIVFSIHLFTLIVWLKDNAALGTARNELSISFEMIRQATQSKVQQTKKIAMTSVPVFSSQPANELKQPEALKQTAEVASNGQIEAADASLFVMTEPDYKAAYLNNPSPGYPLAAKRMGMQGRVVLNVEVLAGGACGRINIHKSSGFTVLDKAALETVKTWHFSPATKAGHAVDKWFMIPIQFSLKDNSA